MLMKVRKNNTDSIWGNPKYFALNGKSAAKILIIEQTKRGWYPC